MSKFVVVQSRSCIQLFMTPWIAACQAPQYSTLSKSLLKFKYIESVMLSNHLILCLPHFVLPSVFLSIRIFSSESSLHIRWPRIGASVAVLPMNIQGRFPLWLPGLISLQSKELSKSLFQHHNLKASILWCSTFLHGPTFTSIYDSWKNHSFDYTDLCQQNEVSAFQYIVLVCHSVPSKEQNKFYQLSQ